MEKSFFFNAVVTNGVADRSYSAEDFAAREAALLSDGVVGDDALKVYASSSGKVHMSAGAAVISGYTYINTGTLSFTITAGDGEYDRIDTLALKLDLGARRISAVMLKGTPSADPVPTEMEDTDSVRYMPLADVRVSAGHSGAVEDADITDRRAYAGYASVKRELLVLLNDYLGDLGPMDSSEITKLRQIIDTVSKNKGKDTVLCGDGVYRDLGICRRVVAAEYTEAGKYGFSPMMYPSEGGRYDIEVQGAGGGGGCHNGTDARGGGGGAGAYLSVSGVSLPGVSYTVTVGLGGDGVPGDRGKDGGASSVDGFTAAGGCGGGMTAGGHGGVGQYCGGDGADGTFTEYEHQNSGVGMGGSSIYGAGALAHDTAEAVNGLDAVNFGAGGSGGACNAGAANTAGGRGADGKVVIYRYVRAEEAE